MQTIKTVNSLVAALTIKRIPESEIIQEIYKLSGYEKQIML